MTFLIRLTSLAFYILLLAVIVVFFTVQGLAFWISSDSGTSWIKSQVQTAAEASGYDIILGDLDIAWMGFKVSDLRVDGGEQGLKIAAQNVRARLNPFPLSLKILNVSLDAETLDIEQYPQADEEGNNDDQELGLPDIFFNSINLGVDIGTISLPDNPVQPFGLSFSQSLSQNDGGEMRLRGEIEPRMNGIALAPAAIENDLIMTQQSIKIAALKIIHDKYDFNLSGDYIFEESFSGIVLKGETTLPSDYTDKNLKPLSIVAYLTGKPDNMEGEVNLNSAYEGENLNLTSDVKLTDTALILNDIDGLADGLDIEGDISLSFDSFIADGAVSVSTNNLNNLIKLAGLDIEVNGQGNVDLRFSENEGNQAVSAIGTFNELETNGVTIQTVSLSATDTNILDNNWPAATVSASNIVQGTTEINQATASININEDSHYLIDLNANGRNINPFTLTADATVLTTDPLNIEVNQARLGMETGTINASGTFSPDNLEATIEGRNINLQNIPFVALPDLPLAISNMTLNFGQTPKNPSISGQYTIVADVENAPETTIDGSLNCNSQGLSIAADGQGEGIQQLDADVTIPLTLSLYPFDFNVPDNQNINGQIAAVLNMGAILPFVTTAPYEVDGDLNAIIILSGAANNPQYRGNITIESASLFDPVSDLTLNDIDARADFNNEALTIEQFNATGEDGTGTLTIDGRVGLADLTMPEIDLRIDAQDMHILDGPPYDVRLNADVAFKSEGQEYLLSGDLTLGEVNILLPENGPDPIPQLNVVEEDNDTVPFAERIRLDLRFVADNKIFIRGYGIDTEMAGELEVTGMASDPQVNGDLASIRGRYEDFGRQFNLEQAVLRFQGSIPPSPYLDIISTVRVDDVLAKVNIQGTPRDPQVSFSSEPALPEDEVLSRILFGEDISTISPFQAIQLANTLRRLSGRGGGGLNLLGSLRNATGLDDIRIEGSGADTRVGAGKYITDKVYLDVTKGAGEESGSARVEVELTPSVSLESEVGQTGENDSNIIWRWDY